MTKIARLLLGTPLAGLQIAVLAPVYAAKPAPPIHHFVYIIQKNITSDHYFGTYPGADGIAVGTRLPYRPGGTPEVAPFHLHQTFIPRDLNHSWQATHVAVDGGKMDGFLWGEWPAALRYYWRGPVPAPNPDDVLTAVIGSDDAPGHRRAGRANSNSGRNGAEHPTETNAPGADQEAVHAGQLGGNGESAEPPTGNPPDRVLNTLSYYDYHEVPNYRDYARRFTLCDHFFSSLTGPGEPNHLYTIAAQSGGLVNNPPRGIAGGASVYDFPTLTEKLQQAHVSWRHHHAQHTA